MSAELNDRVGHVIRRECEHVATLGESLETTARLVTASITDLYATSKPAELRATAVHLQALAEHTIRLAAVASVHSGRLEGLAEALDGTSAAEVTT